MLETKPNWIPPRKLAALAKNPLIQQWLVNYPALNTKSEHLKRFGRLLIAIEYTPERIVKELEELEDDRKTARRSRPNQSLLHEPSGTRPYSNRQPNFLKFSWALLDFAQSRMFVDLNPHADQVTKRFC
jgi:hypothetical protein